jgi:hypothetical protein
MPIAFILPQAAKSRLKIKFESQRMYGSGARATSTGSVVGPNTGLGRFSRRVQKVQDYAACSKSTRLALKITQDFFLSSSPTEPHGCLRSLGIYQYFLAVVLAKSRPDPKKKKQEASTRTQEIVFDPAAKSAPSRHNFGAAVWRDCVDAFCNWIFINNFCQRCSLNRAVDQ